MKKKIGKNYWFGILPHVYYISKGDIALLYNTVNGESIKTNQKKVIKLLEEMHQKQNLGVVLLDQMRLGDKTIENFIDESAEKTICQYAIALDNYPKPIQLMPILNLQKDVEKISNFKGEGVLKYISDITLFLNNICSKSCSHCKAYSNQFFHCTSSNDSRNISMSSVYNLLDQIKNASIRRFAITGGNIFEYPQLEELVNLISPFKKIITFGIHYLNIEIRKIDMFDDFEIHIFINFPLQQEEFNSIIPLFIHSNIKAIFVLQSIEDYSYAEQIIKQFQITNYEVVPFFSGDNISFFEETVFVNETDILSEIIAQRKIFAHQKMNTNFFGNFYILPNSDVKANLVENVIGNIEEMPIIKIAEKELFENSAWRKIRNSETCRDCIYQYLCPSPSNYELVIGKDNLCKYKP